MLGNFGQIDHDLQPNGADSCPIGELRQRTGNAAGSLRRSSMICMEIAAAREVPSHRRFVELAHECGFALAGVAPARPLEEFAFYRQWVADGMAGPMGYLTDHRMAVRSDPRQLLSSARSVLCLGMLYNTAGLVGQASACAGLQPRKTSLGPAEAAPQTEVCPTPARGETATPLRLALSPETEPRPSGSGGIAVDPSATKPAASEPVSGLVSRYAWGANDYHDVSRAALEALAARLKEYWGDFEYRVCVDTAPLLERAYARAAGLGWIGRNTCLINEPAGSWFFLGEILISVELPAGSPPPDRCGSCTRCIDACPTQALVPVAGATGPEWQLDARLCISTLTIEQKGATPEATRAGTGQHLFGCDICQEVCPWNRRSPVTDEPAFQPLNARLDLAEMAHLTRDDFKLRFRSTPVWRSKFEGFLRNAATVMGNSGDPRFVEPLRTLVQSSDPGVAAHAQWALAQLERPAPAIEPNLKEQE
jgi:epoxyqueuosine reductase